MDTKETYVYKKEVDWSLLHEGFTLPIENQVVFGYNMGRFLKRGDSKEINFILSGSSYKARVVNVNYDSKWKRTKDTFQIRYNRNGKLSQELQTIFLKSYKYIKNIREIRPKNDRSLIKLPEESKEYLSMYTTEDDDKFIIEPIHADEISLFNTLVVNNKKIAEEILNYDYDDKTSHIVSDYRLVKIRKLNRKIGDNLKLLYEYRCQICGKLIGKEYNSYVVEAHHIDYFIRGFNNDSNNLLVLCPNHHRIIHKANPVFDRENLNYKYPNGFEEGLFINKHL